MGYQVPVLQSRYDSVYKNRASTPELYNHDGCSHKIQTRNPDQTGILPARTCEPQILKFMRCRHTEEYHCTIGRSFHQEVLHQYCTYSIPPMEMDLAHPELHGLCDTCKQASVKKGELISRMWKRVRGKFVQDVNLHQNDNLFGGSRSWLTLLDGNFHCRSRSRIARYHCSDCKYMGDFLRYQEKERQRERRILRGWQRRNRS